MTENQRTIANWITPHRTRRVLGEVLAAGELLGTQQHARLRQLGLGMLAVTIFVLPLASWKPPRHPQRNPDLILLLNDLAWLPFVGCFFRLRVAI